MPGAVSTLRKRGRMKNVKMTVAAVWAWALVSGALAGRVATFTGAVSTDLSVGGNWDGGTMGDLSE